MRSEIVLSNIPSETFSIEANGKISDDCRKVVKPPESNVRLTDFAKMKDVQGKNESYEKIYHELL